MSHLACSGGEILTIFRKKNFLSLLLPDAGAGEDELQFNLIPKTCSQIVQRLFLALIFLTQSQHGYRCARCSSREEQE